jgi:hypothetical protein
VTAFLWARFVLLAALAAVVVLYVWVEWARHE